MRTIIAGSRGVTNVNEVFKAVALSDFTITQIISGGARGVDTLAIDYARHFNIPYLIFPADWETYGKSAGYIRNQEMAKKADALIAIWDGESRGTGHMIQIAKNKGLKVYVQTCEVKNKR